VCFVAIGKQVLQVEVFKVVEQGETRGCPKCDVQVFGGRPTLVGDISYMVLIVLDLA